MSSLISKDYAVYFCRAMFRITAVGGFTLGTLFILWLFVRGILRIARMFGVIPAIVGLAQTVAESVLMYGPYVFLTGATVMLLHSLVYYLDHDCTFTEAVYTVMVSDETL